MKLIYSQGSPCLITQTTVFKYRANSGMSLRHSQIGKTEEEIITKLWKDSKKLVNTFKDRKKYVENLSTHLLEGTFPSNFKTWDYKPIQFPSSFSQQLIDNYEIKMRDQHHSFKMFNLHSLIEVHSQNCQDIEAELTRIFSKEYVANILETHFQMSSEGYADTINNIFLALNSKKSLLLLNNKTFLSHNIDDTTMSVHDSSEENLILGQNTPDSPPPGQRKRVNPSSEQDNTVDIMAAIKKIAEEVSSLRLRADRQDQTKNDTGPRPAQGRWTEDRNGGHPNIRKGRSRSRTRNDNNHYHHSRYQRSHSRNSYTRSKSPKPFNSNSRGRNNYNRSPSPHHSPSKFGREYGRENGRGRGRNRGHGNQGRHF